MLVGTATTAVRLGEVKAFGARLMPAADWARGLRLPATARFGLGRAHRRASSSVDAVTEAPSRVATPADVDDICMGLPEVELGTSWGDNPTYKVRGKGFLMHRPPGRTAVNPETGEWYDDLLVIHVPGESEKRALVDDERLPFFTIDHFNGYNAVLVQQSRLGEISRDELAEIITDAWLTKAPPSLAKAFLADG